MSNDPTLILKRGTAHKTGPRSSGGIGYQILTNQERSELMLRIISNEGGGYFSNEIVAFSRVEEALRQFSGDTPFAARVLKPAFTTRNANQPGFTAAILRAEGLLAASTQNPSQHIKCGDWVAWRQALLEVPGEPYVPATPSAAPTSAARQITDGAESAGNEVGKSRSKRKPGKPAEGKQHPSADEGSHEDHPA